MKKNRCKFEAGQKASKNPIKINLGRVLGSIWEGFGIVLGLLWVLLAASWPLFERSKSNFFQAFAQNVLQEGFWLDFGSLCEGFGRVCGKILGGFWIFWTHSRKILEMLGMISPCWGTFSKMDPRADPRSVTIRGGSLPQTRVERWQLGFS